MSIEQNKAVVRRFFEEVANKGNSAAADEIIAQTQKKPAKLTIQTLSSVEAVTEGLCLLPVQNRLNGPTTERSLQPNNQVGRRLTHA